jgi:hypothetical protein
MVDSSGMGKQMALQLVTEGLLGIEIVYPRKLPPGASFQAPPRYYTIKAGRKKKKHRSFRMVISAGRIGEYYGLQGTTWKDPPILNGPNERREVGGQKVQIYYDGPRVRLVAWRSGGATYWVSNSLLQRLSLDEMLAIVRSTRPL